MKPENILSNIAGAGEEEQFNLLLNLPNCRIDRIVSSGHSSPKGFWYDQENDEFIYLVQGEATLEFEDHQVTLKQGDYLHIPKNCKHRLERSSIEPICIWLCVFVID
ncbi:MAG: cupin domain-containing protein [Odoribacter sp.]